jgi:hypothetical protein
VVLRRARGDVNVFRQNENDGECTYGVRYPQRLAERADDFFPPGAANGEFYIYFFF